MKGCVALSYHPLLDDRYEKTAPLFQRLYKSFHISAALQLFIGKVIDFRIFFTHRYPVLLFAVSRTLLSVFQSLPAVLLR